MKPGSFAISVITARLKLRVRTISSSLTVMINTPFPFERLGARRHAGIAPYWPHGILAIVCELKQVSHGSLRQA